MRGLAFISAVVVVGCGSLVASQDTPANPPAPDAGTVASSDAGLLHTDDCTGWTICDTFERPAPDNAPWSVLVTAPAGQIATVTDATRRSRVFQSEANPRADTSNEVSALLQATGLSQPKTSLTFETWLQVQSPEFTDSSAFVDVVYLDCSPSGATNAAFSVAVDHRGVYVNVDNKDTVIAPLSSAWQRVAVTVTTTSTTVTVDGEVKYTAPRAFSFSSTCELDLGVDESNGSSPALQVRYDDVRYRSD